MQGWRSRVLWHATAQRPMTAEDRRFGTLSRLDSTSAPNGANLSQPRPVLLR